jgi:hypothetical protein
MEPKTRRRQVIEESGNEQDFTPMLQKKDGDKLGNLILCPLKTDRMR